HGGRHGGEAVGEVGDEVAGGAGELGEGGLPEHAPQGVDRRDRRGRVVRPGQRTGAGGERRVLAAGGEAREVGVVAQRPRRGGTERGAFARELAQRER